MLKYLLYGLILLSILNIFSVNAAELELTSEEVNFLANHPVIRTNGMDEIIPYNFHRDGVPQGYTIDYLELLGKTLGVKFEFIGNKTWTQALIMLQNHELDVLSNMIKSKYSAEHALYSLPINKYTPSIICRKDEELSTIESLNGRSLAVVKDTWYEEIITEYYPKINIVAVDSLTQALKEVAYGNVDATIGNGTVLRYLWLEKDISNLKIFGEADLPKMHGHFECLGIRNDWPIFLSAVNKAIKSIAISDEISLKQKWFNLQNNGNAIGLTVAEMEYLKEKGRLVMCVDPSFMPYEGINNKEEYVGIAADFFDEFQRRLPVPVEILKTSSWKETIDKAKAKECDMLSLLNQSPEREKFLDFSEPYLSDPIALIARDDVFYLDDLESLNGRSVCITEGYYMYDVLSRNYPEVELITVKSPVEALKMVSAGKAFANVTSTLTATRAIQYNGLNNLKIAGQTKIRNNFRVGVVKGNPILVSIMNKAINSIEEKKRNEILRHWYTVGFQHITDWRIVWQIAVVAIFCVLVLLWNIVTSRRNNKRITESNYKLQQKNDELIDLRTQLERTINKLNKLAVTDKLTGLYNRVMIDSALNDELKRASRYGNCFGVILLDVDHFKVVNDTYGHQIGDEVLVCIANLIKTNTRETDIVGRWGGEEFIIICPEATAFGMIKLAENLRKLIMDSEFPHILKLTASFGVTLANHNENGSASQILSRADKALYAAKQSGRNLVKVL